MPRVSDDQLRRVLTTYAGLVAHVLDDPERWLGWGGDDEESDPSLLDRARETLASGVLGRVSPASSRWGTLPPTVRTDWWVARIANVAGLVAATPRVAGALADRLPLQPALGAAASGLAVCAVARENGARDPAAWVPLLATVLFDRTLPAPPAEETATDASALDEDAVERQAEVEEALPHRVRRAARTLLRLAGTFLAVNGMFDERPRGSLPFRMLGKLPVVGVVGGWLDERGAVKKAARETEHALRIGDTHPRA